MSVHYKFKAALDFSTVTFDGIHISVSELKKSIIDQKRLGKSTDFDLQIINAQTKEVYSDENSLIPKNTSVIVARVPITDRKKSGPPPQKENAGRGMHHKAVFHQQSGAEVAKGSDLASMDLTEEEKIKAMMTQSTADYDPSHYVRIRGANQHGRVPDNYRCNRCNQGGHWITKCPNAPAITADVKKSTGIPRSFMVVVDSPNVPGALMTPEGRYAVPAVDHATYADKGKGQQPEQTPKPKIPDDLLCDLCKDLLTDALLIPCCANSYCDDCIRSHLVESDHECPGCHEKDISPTTLIPNRFLRLTVNAFKSESGYSKPEKVPEKPKSPPKPEKPKDGPRKLSLDELPDDLFPHSPKKIGAEAEPSEPMDPDSIKDDLYDFNDGSIPSPFASPKRAEVKIEPPKAEHQAIQSLSRPAPFSTGGPQHGVMRGPPAGGPGGPPPSHHAHHMQRKPYNGPPGQSQPPRGDNSLEPPPPGFEVLPPGEDGSHRPPQHGPNGGPPPMALHDRDNGQRDQRDRDAGPGMNRDAGPGMNRGPPGQQPPPGQQMSLPPNIPPPSFNPMQPPPGFGGGPPGPQHPHGMQQGPPGPPPGYGGPHGPPPPHGPNQNMPPYSNNYNRLPPPQMNRGPMPPMHHGGPPRHHMDHDDFGPRGRGRRPYGPPPPGRMEEFRRDDENRPGTIEDPLKEFERIMREKDRRKKMAAAVVPRKRSKSRSFSPSPRRTPPAYPPKRSRSRSFSRSPSPKRKRPLPAPKRRRSYSRSPSRTPPPIRRAGKSRSRSRNRSLSPPPPGKIRRSPRRAPPQYSPSPPPSRFSRKDKEEFFERGGPGGRDRERDRDRYDDRRYQSKTSSYSSRDYEGKFANPPPPKHESKTSHQYDSQRQPLRTYHGSHSGHGVQHDQPPPSYRDKPPSLMEPPKRPFDFEPNIVPPGTENISSVPSLLDINLHHPSAVNVFPISTIGTGGAVSHHEVQPRGGTDSTSEAEKTRRESREGGIQPTPASTGTERKKSGEDDQDKSGDDEKDHRRKKSPVGKKHKKEKKKHKKKSKDEKKEKRTKKSKSEKNDEAEKSSDDDADTENQPEDTQGNGSKVLPVAEEQKIPVLGDGGIVGPVMPILPLDGLEADSSIGAAKQTAPCDSTVKSPDRVHELEAGINVSKEDAPLTVKGATSEPLKRRDSLASEPTHTSGLHVPDKKSSHDPARPAEELHLPPSRWDEYEDFLVGGESSLAKAAASVATEHDIPDVITGDFKREPTERKVTSEVLKRAEHAIFEKPSKAIPDRDPVKLESKDDIRKFEKHPPSLMEDPVSFQTTIVQQVKPDLKSSSVASTVHRKSAKDRLGSKVSEDDVVLNVSKTIESSVSVRSKVSAVKDGAGGDSSRKRRSRSRSPTYSGRNYRNRSRSREKDTSRRSPPRKDRRRSISRNRRRSASRDRRRSPSREKRRSPSRDRRRSPSKDRRRPSPEKRSDSKSRRRSPSKDRKRSRDRRRSGSRDKARRSRSPEKNKARRSPSRERPRYRSRERPRSNSREKLRRSRSPEKGSSRDKSRRSPSRDRQRSPFRRPTESSRAKEADNRRKDSSDDRGRLGAVEERKESSHFPPRSATTSSTRKSVEEPPSPEARVFQQAGSASGSLRSDQVFSPTLKKQKGRINIKLSSISKAEQQQSGSSSSDDEHEHQEATESKHSESGDEGKRRKKRRHSSTSTKSSSSSDAKRKKKKKDKKKKKKKKKSK